MSSVLLVTGLPRGHLRVNKIVFEFRKTFKNTNIKKFWIRKIQKMPGGNFQQCLVKFTDPEKANKGRLYLENFAFRHNNVDYLLSAEIFEEGEQAFADSNLLDVTSDYGGEDVPHSDCDTSNDWGILERRPNDKGREQRQFNDRGRDQKQSSVREREQRSNNGKQRERSRSPHGPKLTDIDHQIELLRKKRALVEEQKLLLVEEKKLELLKEIRFGNNSNINNKNYELFKKLLEEGEKRGTKEQRASLSKAETAVSTNKPMPKKTKRPSRLNFTHPCRFLIKDLLPIVDSLTQNNQTSRFLMIQLLRSSLRSRLSALLANEEYKSSVEITNMYREKYPQTDDESFVKEIFEKFQQHVPPVVKSDTDNDLLSCNNTETGPASADLKEISDHDNEATMETEHLTSASFDLPANGATGVITIS